MGESGRNAYSRGREHLESLDAKEENKSVLWLHSIHHHSRRQDVGYAMRVTTHFQDSLSRQVTDMFNISIYQGAVIMNKRNDKAGLRVERQQYRRWGAE